MYLYYQQERYLFGVAEQIKNFPMDDYERAYGIFTDTKKTFRKRIEDLLEPAKNSNEKFTGFEESIWKKPAMVFFAIQGTFVNALPEERGLFLLGLSFLLQKFEIEKKFTVEDKKGGKTTVHANVTLKKTFEYVLVFSVMAKHQLKWVQLEYVRTKVQDIMNKNLTNEFMKAEQMTTLKNAVYKILHDRQSWLEPAKRSSRK